MGKLAHCCGEGLEKGEDLPELIALAHVDVSKATAALLPAGQSLLCLHVHEVLEGALLGQTGHTHLQGGAEGAHCYQVPYAHTKTRCAFENSLLLLVPLDY